jgi:hypothetical protein
MRFDCRTGVWIMHRVKKLRGKEKQVLMRRRRLLLLLL